MGPTFLFPSLRRQRQTDVYEFEASFICKVSSRSASATLVSFQEEGREGGRKEGEEGGKDKSRKRKKETKKRRERKKRGWWIKL